MGYKNPIPMLVKASIGNWVSVTQSFLFFNTNPGNEKRRNPELY